MRRLKETDKKIFDLILAETRRQDANIELIASENFTSDAVMEASGSTLTNKYAEGYPGRRWYGGCEVVDEIEKLAVSRAKKLFGAEHVNVQPHSGAQANMAAFFAVLEPKDTVLAMDIACGGHLTHGHRLNFSGRYFNIIPYGVSRQTEKLDYDEIAGLAKRYQPKLILAGASAYPRVIDFKKLKDIADKVGAYLMADIAHIAGLIVAGLHPNPCPYADIVTTTTHKTLRGPRSGMIMCRKELAKKIDIAVFPGTQGGPLMNIIAAKAVCFKEAASPAFKTYQKQVVKNAVTLSKELARRGYRIVSGGTDTHLLLMDLIRKGITGNEAEKVLDRAGITVNKNLIPFDLQSAAKTSGIRLGTPAVTTRGMREYEMALVAHMIDEALSNRADSRRLADVRARVRKLVKRFPLYHRFIKYMTRKIA